MQLERVGEHAPARHRDCRLDLVADGVEHQRDARERLHRPVVEEERESPPLVLLGGDQSLREKVELVPALVPGPGRRVH